MRLASIKISVAVVRIPPCAALASSSGVKSCHSWPRTVDDVVDRAVTRILDDRAVTRHRATATAGCSTTCTGPGGAGGNGPGGAGGIGPGGAGGTLFPHVDHALCHLKASLPLDVAWQVFLGLHAPCLGERRISRPVLDQLVTSGLLVHQTHLQVLLDLTPQHGAQRAYVLSAGLLNVDRGRAAAIPRQRRDYGAKNNNHHYNRCCF